MTAQTILPANTLSSGGFQVNNSVRFNSADSADLRISDYSGAGTSRRIRTYSMWIKRSELSYAVIFGSAGKDHWVFNANNTIQFNIGSGTDSRRVTTRLFTDVTAWYHLVFAYDTTQGTAANRFTLWVNGVETSTAIVGGKNDVQQNEDALVFINNDTHTIGSDEDGASYFDGYMAEWVFVDGQKLDADSFGEYDEDSGIWKPIDVSGLTLGTNGFYLDFKTASDLGIDAGNDNDFEPTNLAATDQSTDTCTNNFATLNPLHSIGAASELSQGNLEYDPAGHHRIISTIAPTSGKWYAEVKGIDSPDKFMAGVSYYPMPANGSASTFAFGQGVNGDVGRWPNDFGVKANGQYGNNNSWSNYMGQPGNNDIIGIYLDLDNYKLYLSLNGTLGSATGKDLTNNGEPYGFISVGEAGTFQWNFGNPSFALANTAITDDNGFGAFEYSPNITGDSAAKKFYALCTKNLAEYG